MEILRKLEILGAAAKYDASCSSSGSNRANSMKGTGSASPCGICHSWADDGRCISLLKILMTNICIYDCAYCLSRRSTQAGAIPGGRDLGHAGRTGIAARARATAARLTSSTSARLLNVYGGAPSFDGYDAPPLAGNLQTYLDRRMAFEGRYREAVLFCYFPKGERVSSDTFDDRSNAFGVAQVMLSHAASDAAKAWLQVWQAMDGDLSATPYYRPEELGRVTGPGTGGPASAGSTSP